jgi:hypothetical protein
MRSVIGLAFLALLIVAGPALADPPARCALIDGRIVSAAEAREIAASWAPETTSIATIDAQTVARALQAELVPISDEGDALIAFAAMGRVRVFMLSGDCVSDWTIVSPTTWATALRAALGDPA